MDQHAYRGALGNIAVGYEVRLTSALKLTASLGHQSYVNTHRDRGYEYTALSLEWRPWR